MQGDDRETEHVLPEEGGGEKILAEDLFLPDRAGHHDQVQERRLDQDRHGRRAVALTRPQEPQDQNQRHRKGQELRGGKDALHHRPGRCVAAGTFFNSIEHQLWGVALCRRLVHLAPPRWMSLRSKLATIAEVSTKTYNSLQEKFLSRNEGFAGD